MALLDIIPLFINHTDSILGVILISVAILLFQYGIKSRRPKNFPPGPKGLPIIGNLHQLPIRKGFLRQAEWAKDYGSIVGFKIGPQNAVVLNSYRHVKELFDKRGAIYSSRPHLYAPNKLICPDNLHILLAQYGPTWKAMRKAFMGILNVNATDALLPIQLAESTQTMCDLLDDPEGYYDHIRRYSTSVILTTVYGQRGESFKSHKVQALYHAQDRFTRILEPGAIPPIDAFPFLRTLPEFLSPWKKESKEIRQEQSSLYLGLMEETKQRRGKHDSEPCLIEKLLDDQENNGLSDGQIAYVGGTSMEAASDTTSSVLLTFILTMTKYPEIFVKMQAELDRVCGSDRSPNFDDLDQLEYVRACMTELFRWRPVIPGGIPHMLTQDDSYEGYVLPKGTIFFLNAWAIHMDENEYEEPEQFIPERFIGNKFGCKSQDDSDDKRRVTYGFGAGRRVCAGQRLAENSVV
ncbi:hypothetical protein N7520_001082 [Penicillium odoratum]|uniref:uncharacterized protein n=1 Tax=Penicillium odoratum TaxID=1167516 RepID=UPI002547EE1A|nr:uncharacterized protein N7520_001082 [Penicillium odoratum]KAJ5777836.1 hypothetical protein N7520_001082 [Penicillium odoratum]